jgi:hypothetical protein
MRSAGGTDALIGSSKAANDHRGRRLPDIILRNTISA